MLMFKLWASTVKLAQIVSNNYCISADGINDFSDIDIDDSQTTHIYDNSSGSECSDLHVSLDCIVHISYITWTCAATALFVCRLAE